MSPVSVPTNATPCTALTGPRILPGRSATHRVPPDSGSSANTLVTFVGKLVAALPTLLLILAGVLVGGTWSLYRQGASKGVVGITALLAVLATVAGVLWLLPGQDA